MALDLAEPIFYSLQMEGTWAGTPAVFIRLSGCNQNCEFCDTDYHSIVAQLTPGEVLAQMRRFPAKRVVITGGEPLWQLFDLEELVPVLREQGYQIHIETNGTINLPEDLPWSWVDWITVSPKTFVGAEPWTLTDPYRIHEIKIVLTEENLSLIPMAEDIADDWPPGRLFIQPCWEASPHGYSTSLTINLPVMNRAVQFVKENPKWRLSLQGHKILDIP